MNVCQAIISLLLLCLMPVFSVGSSNSYLTDDIHVNCGSTGTSAAIGDREWIGDKHPNFTLKGKSTTSSAIHRLISDDPVLHRTARISHSMFSYSFNVNPGQKSIRFHFNPTSYKGFKSSKDFFTLEVGPFTLMSNFSVSLTAQALGLKTLIKEFYISIEENQPLNIVFSPSTCPSQCRKYAFINGIEIVSVPASLSYFHSGDPRAHGLGKAQVIDNTTALEIIHRLNVKLDSPSSGGEVDLFGMWPTSPIQNEDEIEHLTWKRLIDIGFRYLVRIYFSRLGLKIAKMENVMFKILINEMVVDTNLGIVDEMDQSGNVWYKDYLVVVKGCKEHGQNNLSISLQSKAHSISGHKLLELVEILKLSNDENSLASPNPLLPARSSTSWISQNLLLSQGNVNSAVAVALIALISTVAYTLRQLSECNVEEEENKPSAKAERLCRRFSLAEIESATRNFSRAFFIGGGGFGIVYKGLIDNGQQTVAIKRLKKHSGQGKLEFLTEIEILSELRHINLVSLIGYCNERGEMILVYEYMSSGTLSDQLYKLARRNNNNSPSLNWKQRLNICIGAARGLDYLHSGHRLIHRDVKTSNILLDENFVAKVADFGLAKPEDRSKLETHVSTKVKGTPGYIDPHYDGTGRLTNKSDTYAFGVVLLQVLCGRPATDRTVGEDEACLSKWAQNRIKVGEVNQIVAPSLRKEISPDSLKIFVGVAESCLHDEPKKRPTIAQVVLQLEFALEQQERRKCFVGNQITVADETVLPLSSELLTLGSTDVQSITPPALDQTNTESLAENNEIKLKTRKLLARRVWDAMFKRVSPLKKNELQMPLIALAEICEAETRLRRFDFSRIADATNQFSTSNQIAIGRDGFDRVYKAALAEGLVVAVKKHDSSAYQGINEFKREIILLSGLQHRNIIKLLGYCFHGNEMMLVYEFMENGSLDTYIFDEVQRHMLHWALRFKILMGVARGIIYLHQDSRMRIIHRELKPSNILLDSQMNPKITNFGLSRPLEDDQSEMETLVCGTLGYIDPVVMDTGKLSFSADVYTFGILILETISGRKAWDLRFSDQLLSYAWKLWNEGKAVDLVDECLAKSLLEKEALRFIQVGLSCTQIESRRPTMPDVLKMLLGEVLPLDLHAKVAEADKYLSSGDKFLSFDDESITQSDLSPERMPAGNGLAIRCEEELLIEEFNPREERRKEELFQDSNEGFGGIWF